MAVELELLDELSKIKINRAQICTNSIATFYEVRMKAKVLLLVIGLPALILSLGHANLSYSKSSFGTILFEKERHLYSTTSLR